MRQVPQTMTDAWMSGQFVGDQRAVTRVTIQKSVLETTPYDVEIYANLLFSRASGYAQELPNVRSVKWDRSVDGDVATCSMELWNTSALPPGTLPDNEGHFDLQGYFTYNRGETAEMRTRWGVQRNKWSEMLVPDHIVRTYQGYGVDYALLPENDPHLVLTGIWIIDDVTYTADGMITVEMRDMGRLLLDQIMFPPVVPMKKYPLKFTAYHPVKNPPTYTAGYFRPQYDTSTTTNNTIFGHHGVDAFDGDDYLTYWLSNGYDSPSGSTNFEWIQGKISNQRINAVRVRTRGGPYRCYLSVYTDKAQGGNYTGWNGVLRIPTTKSGANITYSQSAAIPYNNTGLGGEYTFTFPQVTGITKVRLTFTNLYLTPHYPHPYRVAVRDIQCAGDAVEQASSGTHQEGDYGDYTEIVKKLLAYGGFHWPANARMRLTGYNTINLWGIPSTGNNVSIPPSADDPYLGTGRVWGDLQMAGVNGPNPLTAEIWDKKPLMDGITYVKDILGFNFWVDETGGAIFRSPNLYKLGNWSVPLNGLGTTRTSSYLTISSDQTLIDLRAKLSSRNTRERVFVANVDGKYGGVARGLLPTVSSGKVNFRRVGGWTDQNFTSNEECQRMAELIMIRQLFTFRQNSMRIAAYPAIQVDDQIKVYEMVTGEAFFHYVRGISSSWDAETGEWTYDLTTSWLGNNPQVENGWAFDNSNLSTETVTFLTALGQF